ncbi:MAG: efflux RND transporter periplasmic adaptor subunit [Candidatus Aminicenantes bacterium]|nr:efflux RND transporter periplasmic adaptor subunit [Candidatus Aminicenantes bacterium]
MIKLLLKILLPMATLALASAWAWKIFNDRPVVETRPPEVPVPVVRAVPARLQTLRLTVMSQGTVAPRTQTTLFPEIAGRVLQVSPSLADGGFFEAGAELLRIDPTDYQLQVVQAEAQIAQAQLSLETEEAQAEVARKEWQSLGKGEASPLLRRVPQIARARAALSSAQAALAQAERNLGKTRISAPFAGRVLRKNVDIGQYVTPGTPMATIYSVDYAEIRLPLPDEELAYVDLPLSYRGDASQKRQPVVRLRSEFGQRNHSWNGRIVRTDGTIDPQTRMIHAIAQVADPYGRGPDPDRPPLAVGMFVEAEIQGRLMHDVVALPRAALRGEDQVLVVDPESKLRFRHVNVVRLERERVLIDSGLNEGELVSLATLTTVVDGMRVQVQQDSNPQESP